MHGGDVLQIIQGGADLAQSVGNKSIISVVAQFNLNHQRVEVFDPDFQTIDETVSYQAKRISHFIGYILI